MTKKEQKLVNKFFFGVIKARSRRFVNAQRFDKRHKPGYMLAVVPVKTVLREWKKLMIELNYGLPPTKGKPRS